MKHAPHQASSQAPSKAPQQASQLGPRQAIPSRRKTLATLGFAVALGVFLAMVAVLPAEYGIDPTGLGRAAGLLPLAQGSAGASEVRQPIQSSAGEAGATPRSKPARERRSLTLTPGQGMEFKLQMLEGQRLGYRWDASAAVHVDMHGEPEGDISGYYESYTLSTSAAMQGQFTALFDGTHGWYWRNDGVEPVRIDLAIAGQYLQVAKDIAP